MCRRQNCAGRECCGRNHRAAVIAFLISVLYGVILGLWYDFFRAVRRKISHRNRTVHMEDIVFCLSAAAGLFLLFQIYNQGSIRFYVLLGLFAGAMGYFFLLSALMGKRDGTAGGRGGIFFEKSCCRFVFSRKNNCEFSFKDIEKSKENR